MGRIILNGNNSCKPISRDKETKSYPRDETEGRRSNLEEGIHMEIPPDFEEKLRAIKCADFKKRWSKQ